jgi:hypothetical protein
MKKEKERNTVIKKTIPDDLILVVIGFFAGILFLWTNLNTIRNIKDIQILLGGTICMMGIPIVYSIYVLMCNKIKLVTSILCWGVRYI